MITMLRWGLFVSCGMLAGCATMSSDFRLSAVGHQDAAIAGRIWITYNGKPFNENCTAMFGTHVLKLSTDGVVLLSVPRGWTPLTSLACKDTSVQHVRVRGAHFFAQGNGWVSDFGDVTITWNTEGGFKPSTMFGLVGALVDAASDDGAASVSVRPSSSSEVREMFRKQTGTEGRWASQPLSTPAASSVGPVGPVDPDDEIEAATPHGFFCSSSPSRSDVNLCMREVRACEQLRAAMHIADLRACAATPSAWCYVSGGQLRCYGGEDICGSHAARDKESNDLCAEER